MRVVADTNIIISGTLWHGDPRRVLDAARDGLIELFTSLVLLEELEDVLCRDRFASRLSAAAQFPKEIVNNYSALASVVEPAAIEPVIVRDPDDDAVIACAITAECDFIVSGDLDLLDLVEYRGIRIIRATELLAEIGI